MAFKFGNTIITDGLVFYVDAANKGSYNGYDNKWYDLTKGDKNAGTIVGATYDETDGVSSFSFNGTSNYIYGVDPTGDMDAAFYNKSVTIEIAYQPASPGSGYMFQYGNTNIRTSYGLSVGGTNQFSLLGITGVGTLYQIPLDKWNATTLSYNISNGVRTGYKNGSPQASYTLPIISNILNNRNWTIGANANLGTGVYTQLYKGRIAYIRIYNRVLSDAEVLQNYNALRWRFNL